MFAGAANNEFMNHAGGHMFADVDGTGKDLADGEEDFLGGLLFGDVAHGSGAQDALGIEGFIVHGEDEDGEGGKTDFEVLDQLQTVAVFQGNIGNDNAGFGGGDFI